MRIRSIILTGLVAAAAVPTFTAQADNAFGDSEVILGVIDTGVRASHQEFDYQGPDSTTDQFVAWWDFSTQQGTPAVKPTPGQMWDTRKGPYDGHGHGTAVASSSAGLNKSSRKERAYFAGGKLAIAKVGTDSGTINGDISAAIRWMVDTVKVDVINMSIGSIVPWPALFDLDDESIDYARNKGVLFVTSNGNGCGNAAGPCPGWADGGKGASTLSVGASSLTTGATIHTDPEIAGKYTQHLAAITCDTCYRNISGTSFSSPQVAGMAAELMRIAIANGRDASADYIETLLKYTAYDTNIPPNWEGYGQVNVISFEAAKTHAAAGTLPTRPSPDLSGMYVETVRNGAAKIWNEDADGYTYRAIDFDSEAGAGQGSIGPSLPNGLADADVYQVTLAPGASFAFDLAYTYPAAESIEAEAADIDVYLYRGVGDYRPSALAAKSTNSAGVAEAISYASAKGGTYSLIVVGWVVAERAGYTATTSASFVTDQGVLASGLS